jgi:hypothetical protein
MWHLIVASFWVVLALPGIQAMALGRGETIDIHPARSWFLAGLIGFTVLNSLLGRYGLCALLGGIGQLSLFGPFLPWPLSGVMPGRAEVGWLCLSVAVVAALLIGRLRRPAPSLDTLWRDFRDAFGAVWSLRVAEQLNETARRNGWPVQVGWHGFDMADKTAPLAELTQEQRRAFRQSLANLLRRFVDQDWIARRWTEE